MFGSYTWNFLLYLTSLSVCTMHYMIVWIVQYFNNEERKTLCFANKYAVPCAVANDDDHRMLFFFFQIRKGKDLGMDRIVYTT